MTALVVVRPSYVDLNLQCAFERYGGNVVGKPLPAMLSGMLTVVGTPRGSMSLMRPLQVQKRPLVFEFGD